MSTTVIWGVVTDASTSQVITNATVTCPTLNVANNNGTYSSTATSDGTYHFTASAPGYTSQEKSILAGGGVESLMFALDAV